MTLYISSGSPTKPRRSRSLRASFLNSRQGIFRPPVTARFFSDSWVSGPRWRLTMLMLSLPSRAEKASLEYRASAVERVEEYSCLKSSPLEFAISPYFLVSSLGAGQQKFHMPKERSYFGILHPKALSAVESALLRQIQFTISMTIPFRWSVNALEYGSKLLRLDCDNLRVSSAIHLYLIVSVSENEGYSFFKTDMSYFAEIPHNRDSDKASPAKSEWYTSESGGNTRRKVLFFTGNDAATS